ncbi:NAD-dependent epimerase/dehydratase family protein [Phenylobacterium sp.]|uniref:NAD-dependent epimerase/dehydratase family protein n=1 Tax=Phenylobacterium sp. TaxID=1871053 RepID=UPI0035B4C72E
MAKVMVTGGSGFLGSLMVAKLLEDGHDVVSLDLLPAEASHPRLEAVVGDIRDRAGLDALFARTRPEVVFHLAAQLAHGHLNEDDVWTSNAVGTAVLADAMAAAGVRNVVYTSSNCLWGRGFDAPVTEDEPPAPVELYGKSKWEGEKALLDHPAQLHAAAIRCPTIIDEGRLGLLAILFEFIADGRRVWTVGGGRNRYQFIYAADLIDAMLRAWRRDTRGVFGIGSDDVQSLRDNFQHVIDQSGSRSRIGVLPKAPTLAAMRLAHALRISPLGPYHYRMIAQSFMFDTSRIKAELDWRPTLTNGDMLLKAYRYYHANRDEIAARKDVSAHRQSAKMGVIRVLKWVS